jgi:sugar lactone lactonase YvrE
MLKATHWILVALALSATSAWASYEARIIDRGAIFHGSGGINISPTGRIFVTDTDGGRIVELDPVTGAIISEITSAQGAYGPSDLDFDATGNIVYWNNFLSGEIFKRDLTTGVSTQLAALHGIVDTLALNNQGRLFAAEVAPIPALWEIDPNGVNPPVLIANNVGMDGIDAGPDGNIYTPDFFGGSGEVRKIDVNTGAVTVVASGLEFPIAVKFNNQGKMHVVEYFKGEISRIDLVTGQKTHVAQDNPGLDNFDFDPSGRIYTANVVESSVKRLFPISGYRYLTRPGTGQPGPIAVRKQAGVDFVYVGDIFSIRKMLGLTGTLTDRILSAPVPNLPSMVQSLYDDGTNFVTTAYILNLVQVVNPDTKQVVEFHTDFAVPLNAVRFEGELAVAELGTGQVVRGSDRAPYISNLVVPAGLAVNGNNLYVGDYATGVIYQAVKNGMIQNPPLVVKTGLSAPEGMTVDGNGDLLVAETGTQSLVRINPTTHQQTTIVSGLSIGLPAPVGWAPTGSVLTGVTVSPSGVIYVGGDIDNVVYRIHHTLQELHLR